MPLHSSLSLCLQPYNYTQRRSIIGSIFLFTFACVEYEDKGIMWTFMEVTIQLTFRPSRK
uniref:Uncharacterized protein n=1 Tax=Rhizophora mucronata TaxID=61149 RepID=A0A2P2N4J9_RHIMU